jgi:hypothetical protein
MAWFKGTATDYHDFMNQLKNLAKDDHISAAAVQDGGTGYAIGDTITLSGGTKYHEPELEVRAINSGDYITVAAVNAGGSGYAVGDSLVPTTGTYDVAPELEVLTESGGAVATILIKNPGICSAQPTNPVATTTDGSGTGCTIDFTFTAGTGIVTGVHISDAGVYTTQATNPVSQNTSSGSGTGAKFTLTYTDTAWTALIDYDIKEATVAAISTAGTGYTVNDIVTVSGGTATAAATVKITAVSGGVPTAVAIETAGEYSTTPGNPASTSGGTGSGLTLTMTWADQAAEGKLLLLKNTNSSQHLGFRAFKWTTPSDAYLIELSGTTGFNTLSTPWDQQPGSTLPQETYTALSGGASPATINYWMSVDDNRIVSMFKVGTVYPNLYVGGIDKFLTDTYNYPQLIMGCLSDYDPVNYGGVDYAGMNNPGSAAVIDKGPGVLRAPGGDIRIVRNWTLSAGNPLAYDADVKIQPCGGADFDPPTGANEWYTNFYHTWQEMFRETIVISGTQDSLKRTNSEFSLIPCTLVEETANRIYGNMIGVFAVEPDGVLQPEDRIYIGTDVYRVFQNCNKTSRNYFFAVKEA